MSNHIPMRIDIELENPHCILSNCPFDGILARLWIDKQKLEGEFDGNYDAPLPFLKESDGVYHASVLQYSPLHLSNHFMTSKFDADMHSRYGKKVTKSFIDGLKVGKGQYKPFFIKYETKYVEYVHAYVNGDFSVISELLESLRYIGKKPSLGYGKVKHISINEIEDDYSLLKENVPMRNLPMKPHYKKLDNTGGVIMPLRPPYWKRQRGVPCYVSKEVL